MHEADKYALIIKTTGVVENVILYCPDDSCPDHPTSWSPPTGYSIVKLDPTIPPVNPGDIYNGKKFISAEPEQPDTPQEAQPLITEDEASQTPAQDITETNDTEVSNETETNSTEPDTTSEAQTLDANEAESLPN